MQLGITCLDDMYILIKQFQVFLTAIVANRTVAALSLGYIKLDRLRLYCAVAVAFRIVISIFYGRYSVFALMTRHCKEIIYLLTLYTVTCQLSVVCYFCIVSFKVLWKFDYRVLYKFHIAYAIDCYAQCHRVVGFAILSIDRGGYAEMPHSS